MPDSCNVEKIGSNLAEKTSRVVLSDQHFLFILLKPAGMHMRSSMNIQ
jgi:hypothetical protein